jgi:hypothetical protein
MPRMLFSDGQTRRELHANGDQEDVKIETISEVNAESSNTLVESFSTRAAQLIDACDARQKAQNGGGDSNEGVFMRSELKRLIREVGKLTLGPGLDRAEVGQLEARCPALFIFHAYA